MRKMKDSGIEWIGEIPESWDVGKLGYFIQVFNGDRSSNYPSGNDLQEEGIPFLTSSNLEKDELTLDECKYITQEKYDSMGGFKMQINDIIYCLRGSVGKCSINLTEEQGTVASSLMGIRCTKIDPKFLLYILKSSVVDTQNALFINGTCAANLSAENVFEYRIPILDTKTQVDIVDYLDKKCAEIDAIIAVKEKTNELLKERRQSIIYEAVTKGLDPTVPMKDSGVEWIGKVPFDWTVCKIKHFVVNEDGVRIGPFGSALTNRLLENGEYNVYSQANLIAGDFASTKHTIDEETFNDLRSYEVLADDICVSMMGTIGKCMVVPNGIKPGIMDSHLIKIRLKSHVNPKFFEYVYDKDNSGLCFAQMKRDSKGTIMDGLNSTIVKNLFFPLPSLDIQNEIVDYLDETCCALDTLITANESTIAKLKEYRQSVIYEALTGKVEI